MVFCLDDITWINIFALFYSTTMCHFVATAQLALALPRKNMMCRDRNWEVQAGSPDKIFDKKCLYV